MEKAVRGVVLLCTFFMLMKNGVICEKISKGWQTYTKCLQDAATLYEGIVTLVCGNRSISEPVKWLPERCKDICTIKASYSDCTDNAKISFSISDGSVAIFPLPKFSFECANCHNLSHVNITCSLRIECMEKRFTGIKPENIQKKKVNSISTPQQTTETSKPEAVSNITGIPAEIAVAATLTGFILGILATISVWLLKRKISKHKSCSETTTKNTTHSHNASLDLPDPVGYRLEDLYARVDKHKPKNTSVDEGGIYNHLNEKNTDPEESSSKYNHAPYITTRHEQPTI